MEQFINKPEDYDSVVHKNTRFVLVEKTEDNSKWFYYRMQSYWKCTGNLVFKTLRDIIKQKQNNVE